MKKKYILLFLFIAVVIGACASPSKTENKLIITATPPIADIVQSIVGSKYKVKSLVAPGQSPHTFSIGAKEAALIEKAVIWVKTGIKGIGTENQIQKFARSNKKLHVVYINTDIHLLELKNNNHHHHHKPKKHEEKNSEKHDGHEKHKKHEHIKNNYEHKNHEEESKKSKKSWNPHIWLSVKNVVKIAENIKNGLSKFFPSQKELFIKNFNHYQIQLNELEKEIAQKLKAYRGLRFVQFHPAWDYFAHDYGLVLAGVVEMHLGHEQTSGLHEMKELVKNIKKLGAKVIFAEVQFKSTKLRQIAEDLQLKVVHLDPLGGMKDRKSYIQLMRWNLNQILKAIK